MSTSNKKLLLLVIAVILFIAGGMYLENRWSQQAAIQRVLAADSLTTRGASSAAEIVRRMQAIDLDGCPTDFQIAYRRHTRAWESYAGVELQAQQFMDANGFWRNFTEGFIRGLLLDVGGISRRMSELSAEEQRILSEARQAQQSIADTWGAVEDVALSHGVKSPKAAAKRK